MSRQHPSLRARLFRTLLLLAVAIAAVALIVTGLVFQESLVSGTQSVLALESDVVAEDLAGGGPSDDIAELASRDFGDVRATLVAPDGTVLYDSLGDEATMPNHRDRPEVAEALAGQVGESVRSSDTLGNVSVYRAERLPSGNVLRLSVDRSGVGTALMSDMWLLALLFLAIVTLSWVLARVLTERIMGPITAIDPKDPGAAREDSESYDELMPVVDRLVLQQDRLHDQMYELRSANEMRQEFTANVTHELKTPLASISAAAELIRDGIARPEDVPDFAARIHKESMRLTSLVSDILTLSKLDEVERRGDRGFMGSTEPCDLLAVCRDVTGRLGHAARRAGVTVGLEGESVQVLGNPRLLDELVHNLCDNAIRYSGEGCHVRVSCGVRGTHPFVEVADDGRGIAEEEQPKVFERFYRVESSRSRELGGTGLGLAIVKHAANFHDASIALESELGEGTTVTVTFPATHGDAEVASGPAAGYVLPSTDPDIPSRTQPRG